MIILAVQYDKDNGWSSGWIDIFKKNVVETSREIDGLFSKITSGADSIKNYNGFGDMFNAYNITTQKEDLEDFFKTFYKSGDVAKEYQKYMIQSGKATTQFTGFTKKAGNALKSFGAAMASMAATWVISEILGYLFTIEQRAEAARQEMIDLGKETAETNKQLSDLISQYEKLGEDGKIDTSELNTAKTIQEQIVELVGNHYEGINLANGAYDEQIKKLKEIQAIEAGESYATLYDAKNAAEESLKKAQSGLGQNVGGGAFTTKEEHNAIVKLLKDTGRESLLLHEEGFDAYKFLIEGDMDYSENAKYFVRDYTADTIVKSYYDMIDLKDTLAKSYKNEIKEGGNLYDFYNDLTKKINDLSSAVDNYKSAVENYETNEAIRIFYNEDNVANDYGLAKGTNIKTQEDFDSYIESVENADGITETLREHLIGVANSVFPQFCKVVEEIGNTIEGTSNKMTVSLSDLEKASDNIKTLGTAFKELSDDGYITTKTLGEIKTAVGMDDETFEQYKNTLLNAKAGFSEFNDVMSDLTYKILDSTFKKNNLVDATEEEIAAILRENGVINAEAVARSYLAETMSTEESVKAKAKATNFELSESIDENSKKLIEEAKSCGISTAAYAQLVAQETIFNDNDLDISDKISKLATLQQTLGQTTSAAIELNAAWAGQTMDSRREFYTSAQKYGLKTNSRGLWEYNGVEYTSGRDALNTAMIDDFIKNLKIDIPDIDFPGTTTPKSTKNEAIDNYLKDAENRYKVHQDETKYINDLNYALQNLVKTKDEELDITDKINDAYRDLADNRIGDLEHQIELQKELYGENVDVTSYLRKIQRVAHEEANRLRSMGYDDNSKEIQDLQKIWWDAENEIKNSPSKVFEQYKKHIENITDDLQDQADAYDILIDKQQALVDAQEKMYDAQAKVRESQREISKELATSKALAEYADEDMRENLFNDEDYNKLDKKLKSISGDIGSINAWYNTQINNLTEDNWYLEESITKEYERRLASKEKEYEIARAELDLEKKRMELNNILNEKNIRMLTKNDKGAYEWTYVHNYEEASRVVGEIAEKEGEISEIRLQAQQDAQLAEKQAKADMLSAEKDSIEQRIKLMNDEVEEMAKVVENITDPLEEFGGIMSQLNVLLKGAINGNMAKVNDLSGSVGKTSTNSGSLTVPSKGYYSRLDYQSLINDAVSRGDNEAAAEYEKQRNAKIDGEKLDYEKTYKYHKPFDKGGFADGKGFLFKDTDAREMVLDPKHTQQFMKFISEMDYVTQHHTNMMNNLFGNMSFPASEGVVNNKSETINYNIGDIVMNGVQDMDGFAREFKNGMAQNAFRKIR